MNPSEKNQAAGSSERWTTERVESLLRQYARLLPLERLLSEPRAAALRKRIGPSRGNLTAATAARGAATARDRHRLPKALRTAGALAAAVLIAVLLSVPKGLAPPLAVAMSADAARDPASLFSTMRGADAQRPDAPLYIGVRLKQPAFVRIIGVDETGRVESFWLDEAAREEMRVEESHLFGGYPTGAILGEAGEIRAILVVASPRPIEPVRLATLLNRAALSVPHADAEAVARRVADALRAAFGCTVRMLTL